MKRLDSTTLMGISALVLMLSTAAPDGFSQYYASAGRPRELQRSAGTRYEEPMVTLKDALQDLKKRYHFRFAYREGLLEGKIVPAAVIDQQQTPEAQLQRMLSVCNLNYKQINKKQFSIFSEVAQTAASAGEASSQAQGTDLASTTSEVFAPSAPDLTITGTVLSADDGQGLPGVNVVVKGTTMGTTTDSDGKYTLSAPEGGGVLVFSFIGYATQEAAFNSTQTVVNVSLQVELMNLGEVVVTALGIEKERSSLGYSVTEVQGEQFTQARENNLANALTGKIAGVNATGMSTGPGGSSRVIIRGNGSLTGNNQPLYVINGMPMDNSTPGGSAVPGGATGNTDRGDGIGGINPDDIESISVLKGGTAAALYGSRAANGVILITTKKGKGQKGVGVEYNGTFTAENVSVFPKFQDQYGSGDWDATTGAVIAPRNQTEAIAKGRRSWGPALDGRDVIGVDGQMHPYVAQKNNIKNFYTTGTTLTNTLALTGGNENITYRLSGSDMNSNSILPNTTFNRKVANMNVSGKLSEKLSFEGMAQYNLEHANNRPNAGDALGNPNWLPYMAATSLDVTTLAPGYDPTTGKEILWNDAPIASNGYFVRNKYQQHDRKNRFIGQMGVTYKILKNLSVKGVLSRDFYNYNYNYIVPTATAYVPNGQYISYKTDAGETNGLLMINYNTNITEDLTFAVMVGGNQMRKQSSQLAINGSTFTIPFLYSTTNLATQSTAPTNLNQGINSVFGSVDLGYKSLAFLTVTSRQDWFSTLAVNSNTKFYPSVGGSFVLSEAFQMPRMFDFAKLRASWAQVGGGAPDPYQVNQAYSIVPGNSRPIQQVYQPGGVAQISNPSLKPFTSTTYEVGMDLQFFHNRLGLDLTYYNRSTTNDIVSITLSPATGYNAALLNVGELSNKGIEMLLTGSPIKGGNFSWNVSYNLAYNKNEVIKLAPGLNSIQMGATVNSYAYINNVVGQSFGSIVGTRIQHDANGAVIRQANGFPVPSALQTLGNGVPPWTMGITNEFKYKNFGLNILVDGKFGNKVFSLMEVYAMRLGLLKETLPGRGAENGLDLTGVTTTGAPVNAHIGPDKLPTYYDNNKLISEYFLHDGSFVKLRQIIFSYTIPVKNLSFLKIHSASVSLVGRNLAILYKKTKNFDPEQGYTNGPAQGFESFGLPRTRSYGINLSLKF